MVLGAPSPAEMHGVTYDDVHRLTSAGRVDELVGRVVERFRAVERRCDAVLCAGSDFTDVAAPTEFALNLRLADNLGAPVLAVVSGRRKRAADVVGAIHVARDALTAAGNAIVAIIANRVDPAMAEEVWRTVKAEETGIPTYVLPSDPVMSEPTVGQVSDAVNARLLFGDPAELDRDVHGVIVGAATLGPLLDHLVDGALVITPGDRSDVILGVLAAAGSSTSPPSAACCSPRACCPIHGCITCSRGSACAHPSSPSPTTRSRRRRRSGRCKVTSPPRAPGRSRPRSPRSNAMSTSRGWPSGSRSPGRPG